MSCPGILWNQNAPFNNLTPMDGHSHSNAGCVAVSMAQVMKYHRFLKQGIGQTKSYTTRTGMNVPSVNLEVNYKEVILIIILANSSMDLSIPLFIQ